MGIVHRGIPSASEEIGCAPGWAQIQDSLFWGVCQIDYLLELPLYGMTV